MNISPEREKAWTDILTESSMALGKEPLTGYALAAGRAAFERINSRIPTHLLLPMYVKSMELRGKNGAPVFWDARAISLAYDKYLEEREGRQGDGLDKSRLLANPGRDCLRCFGANPKCPHDKLTPDEEKKYRDDLAKQAADVREALKQMVSVKAMPPVKVTGDITVTYTCTECGRRVNSTFGWNYHDRCNERLPGPVRDGEKYGCQGVMEVL